MTFVLLDSLSLPGGLVNEDAFGCEVGGHDAGAAVVMDGATPLGDGLMPGPSDAAWIAQFGARRLLAHLRDGEGPRKALRGAQADTQKSFEALRRYPPQDKWQTPCASMMLAVRLKDGIECLWFGDCAALVQTDKTVTAIGDGFDSKAQESLTAAQAAKDNHKPATAREHHIDLLRDRRNRLNSGNYWLFSPDEKAAAHASRRIMKAPPGAHLLLASDGFLALATDYGAYSADTLIRAARDKGLAALGTELRAIEAVDAQGVKFPRFKTSDDATALLLKLI
jgi:hypothetical protein